MNKKLVQRKRKLEEPQNAADILRLGYIIWSEYDIPKDKLKRD